MPTTPDLSAAAAPPEYGKKHPFPASTLATFRLNGAPSEKDTYHLELSLAGSGMSYEPGDALAVIPINVPDTVELVMLASGLRGDEIVEVKNLGPRRVIDALREDFDISGLSRAFLTKLAEATACAELRALLADDAKDALKAWTQGREIIDALESYFPRGLPAEVLFSLFRRLPPRLYSIASSPLAHPAEVHLTVAVIRYQAHGRQRKGVCTNFLADLVGEGDPVPVFVQPNKNFRLPADPAVPVIMVGPGTGVAPFRAFVEHRAALGAPGRNWLFFGNPHHDRDYFYQAEWERHLKSGTLTRLDLAFSRDQPEKIYVQHRMAQQARELYAWLEEGAYFYVCGNASHMAADVHEALLQLIQTQGGKSREEAIAYADALKQSHRYQRDVY